MKPSEGFHLWFLSGTNRETAAIQRESSWAQEEEELRTKQGAKRKIYGKSNNFILSFPAVCDETTRKFGFPSHSAPFSAKKAARSDSLVAAWQQNLLLFYCSRSTDKPMAILGNLYLKTWRASMTSSFSEEHKHGHLRTWWDFKLKQMSLLETWMLSGFCCACTDRIRVCKKSSYSPAKSATLH